MATHSSVLAWRIPGMGDPGGLPSVGSHRVRHDWSDLAAAEAASLYYIWSYDLLVHGFIKEFSNTLLSIKLVVVMLVAQSCLTLCDPMDCSPPGSSVHGILQAKILEWVACPPPDGLSNPGIKYHKHTAAAAAAKSFQSCPTLCDPIDGSPPGFPVPGTLQARTLEWVAISFSNTWKWQGKWSRSVMSNS